MHFSVRAQKLGVGRVACCAGMDEEEEPIEHILESFENLSDLSLVRILAYLAAEISSRAAEAQNDANLAVAPWRLAKGKSKGKGKGGPRNSKGGNGKGGKGQRGRDGPY